MKLEKLTSEEAPFAEKAYDSLALTIFAAVEAKTPPHIVTRVLIWHAANSAAAMELPRAEFLKEAEAAYDRAAAVIPPEMS